MWTWPTRRDPFPGVLIQIASDGRATSLGAGEAAEVGVSEAGGGTDGATVG
jgi:hypothetical protein